MCVRRRTRRLAHSALLLGGILAGTAAAERDEIAGQGGEMMLMVYPFAIQIDGEGRFTDALHLEIERRCRQNGNRCLDLLPGFREAGGWGLFARPDYIHPPVEGNRVAAAAIEEALGDLLAGPTTPRIRHAAP